MLCNLCIYDKIYLIKCLFAPHDCRFTQKIFTSIYSKVYSATAIWRTHCWYLIWIKLPFASWTCILLSFPYYICCHSVHDILSSPTVRGLILAKGFNQTELAVIERERAKRANYKLFVCAWLLLRKCRGIIQTKFSKRTLAQAVSVRSYELFTYSFSSIKWQCTTLYSTWHLKLPGPRTECSKVAEHTVINNQKPIQCKRQI